MLWAAVALGCAVIVAVGCEGSNSPTSQQSDVTDDHNDVGGYAVLVDRD